MMRINLKNIISYFQGNIRYNLYYSRYFKWMIRKHIQEQYIFRISTMNQECFNSGSCVVCGCSTPHLQFSNRPCEGDCYPKMMNKKNWEKMKQERHLNYTSKRVKQ